MRLWLSKNSEIPAREQLATQMLLGILSKDLQPGEKLPSTRELARRLRIHPNTVSAAYRDLVRRGWVEYRKGSGIYVPARHSAPTADTNLQIDQMISEFFHAARERGIALGTIYERLSHWLSIQPPDRLVVVEPDRKLREILVAEIQATVSLPVSGAGPNDLSRRNLLAGAAGVFMLNREDQVRPLLPPRLPVFVLLARSVPAALSERQPIPSDALLTVVSCWPEFLRWAKAVLVAAGASSDALNFCDSDKPGWRRAIRASTAVITDAVTAKRIPEGSSVIVFRLIADSSLEELRELEEWASGEERLAR